MENPWLPPVTYKNDGGIRRVGVEIELANVPPQAMIDIITQHFGGEAKWHSAFDVVVENTSLGDFKIELDSRLLKDIASDIGVVPQADSGNNSVESLAISVIESAASQFVPWEIVTAPIEMTNMHKLMSLVDSLRKNGAKGTHSAAHYAFGVHLNPELPALDAQTILRYLQAFLIVYPYIISIDKIALSRRITPHINHFSMGYQKLILSAEYRPTLEQLIDDYLAYNPTRNRSLDMLPLFKYLQHDRVQNIIDDERIQPRPTFHYRLQDCDLDNPDWNIHIPWRSWLWIEHLVENKDELTILRESFVTEISRLTYPLDSSWPEAVQASFEHTLGVNNLLTCLGESL